MDAFVYITLIHVRPEFAGDLPAQLPVFVGNFVSREPFLQSILVVKFRRVFLFVALGLFVIDPELRVVERHDVGYALH